MGIYDEAFLKSIPDLTLAMPSTLAEAKILYATSLEKGHGVFAIRYPHCLTNELAAVPNLVLPYGAWRVISPVKPGKPAVIAVGPNGLMLMEKLGEAKYGGALINPLYLNPILDENVKMILPCSEVFIFDPYGTVHGFVESLAAALAVHHFQGQVHIRAIPSAFIHHASVADQEKECHVSVDEAFHDILDSLSK
jgi:deoxyxylulose-5-phosphate synthase